MKKIKKNLLYALIVIVAVLFSALCIKDFWNHTLAKVNFIETITYSKALLYSLGTWAGLVIIGFVNSKF